MSDKKTYDLVVSLGGNCSAASNLKYRKMRHFSLPFDWVYMKDSRPLVYLCEGFKDNFKNLALYQNLHREQANVSHKIIYSDSYSGYFFPNHFSCDINEKVYEEFNARLRRRADRLISKLRTGKKVLFILTLDFEVDNNILFELYDSLSSEFDADIDFEVMIFGMNNSDNVKYKGMNIRNITRMMNDYDFYKTNFEWAFLDNIEIANDTSEIKTKTYSGWTKLFGKKVRFSISIEDCR